MAVKRILLREIADKAGVTRMTASLALRGKRGVSEVTRQVVLQAADQLGYQPDPELAKMMSHLRTREPVGTHDCLALLTSGSHPEEWMESRTERKFLEGVELRARDYGYRIEKFWMDEPGLTPARLTKIIWSRGIEGVIVAPLVGQARSRTERTLALDFSRFSVVQVSDTVETPSMNCAIHDQYISMLHLLDQLASLHYRRMGLVLAQALDLRVNRRWTAAFLQYREQARQHELPPPLIMETADQKRFDRWFRRYRPDVIISLDLFGLHLLRPHGLKIPRDIGYASLDLDGEVHEYPGLSGIDQNCHLVGSIATDMLVAAIHRRQHGISIPSVRSEVEGSWIAGNSVRPQGKRSASHRVAAR